MKLDDSFLEILQKRFQAHPERHKGVEWGTILDKLKKQPDKIKVLMSMESTGGEPDVVSMDPKSKEIIFMDCSPESPKDRRSLCFDEAALNSRKENKPKSSVEKMAVQMGVILLDENDYRILQQTGKYDNKTSSWIETPERIRKLGGALFCDRRYDTVFTYHNGAESYYAARGFRGKLTI